MKKKETDVVVGVAFADTHTPYHDVAAVSVLQQVIEDIQPNILIDLGDTGDFESLCPFNRNKPRLKENKRIKNDIVGMYDLSKEIGVCAPKADKVKLIGNHEYWLTRYIDEHPELDGWVNLEEDYQRLGWDVVPYGHFYNVGRLIFHHGDRRGYTSRHHAKQWAAMGRSIVYGHVHDVQRHTHETITRDGKPDKHAAFSIGCLCKLDRDWMLNQINRWQQGFGVFYVNKATGYFNFYHVDITKGSSIFNGKVYHGKV